MKRSHAPLLAAFALASFVACGGSVAQEPEGPGFEPHDPRTSPEPDSPYPQPVTGDYELTFADVTAVSPAHPADRPSKGAHARLSIVSTSAGLVAILTPYFGTPTRLAVTQGPFSLTLTTSPTSGPSWALFGENEPYVPLDGYRMFTIPQTTYGSLGESFTASGDAIWYPSDGDGGATGALLASGTIRAVEAHPDFRVAERLGLADAPLPWDPIIVQASEPRTGGLESFGISGAIAGPFVASPAPALFDGGWIEAQTSLLGFDVPADGKLRLTGSLGGMLETNLKVRPVGAPRAAITFDDAAPLATWGGATHPEAATCGEGASCLQLGPWAEGPCTTTRIGLAARLITLGKTRVHVFYRVLVGGGESAAPHPFTLQLAAPGGARLVKTVDYDAVEALAPSDPAVSLKDVTGGSAWKTATFELPSAASEHGLALVTGHADKSAWCHPGRMVTTTVLLGAITLD